MTSALTSNPCRLLLYYSDKRTSKNDCTRLELKVSDLPQFYDFVCKFFWIEEDWSKKLIGRLFDEDLYLYQSFELRRREREDLAYHIRVVGNIDDHDTGIEFNPLCKKQKLSIHYKTNKLETTHILNYEELAAFKMDNSVIALFNNHTFNSLVENNSSGTQERTIKIIDLQIEAKL